MSEPPTQHPWSADAGPQQPGVSAQPGGPVPVRPLPYVAPDRAGRPRLVTAIGVISIVVASLSGFWGLLTTFQAIAFYMMSLASAQAAQARVATVAAQERVAQQAGGAVDLTPGKGMTKAERDATVQALARLQPLSPARRRQLDTILEKAGRETGAEAVTGSGVMPAMRSGEAPPAYFETAKGRLEVFNDRAVFYPRAGPIVRATAPPEPPPGAPQPAPGEEVEAPDVLAHDAAVRVAAQTGPVTMPSPGVLSPVEVQSVVKQAQAASSNALNSAQANALTTVLSAPAQVLVTPGAAEGAVTLAYAQPNGAGAVVVQFSDGGSVTLGPQGNVMSVMATRPFPTFAFNPLAMGLMLVASLVSMALAVYLLVCGILMLRQSPRARRLHLVYAFLKIPVAVTAGVASAWLLRDWTNAMAAAGGGAPAGGAMGLFMGATPLVLGCAYPLALLIALNLRTVRDYYHVAAGGGAGAAGVTSA